MILTPDRYDQTAPYELLLTAERGLIGFDHRLLRSLDARRESTLPALQRFTAEFSTARADQRIVDLEEPCFDLWRYLRAAEAAPFYIHLLAKYGEDIPDGLVEALAELGAPAVEPLLIYLDSLAEDDSSDVLFILASLGIRDPRIREKIVASLRRDPFEGAVCLGAYGDPDTLADIDAALAGLAEDRSDERRALSEARATIGNGVTQREFPPYDIFDLYPEQADPLFDVLRVEQVVEFLSCDLPAWCAAAAASLQDEAYPDEARDALMRAAASGRDPQVRGNALRALSERAAEPAVASLLVTALENEAEPWAVRCGALIGLAFETGDTRIQGKLAELYNQPEARAAALEAMWRSQNPRHGPNFVRDLEHTDTEVRRQAILGLGVLDLTAEAARLVPLFQDSDLRQDALYSYSLCCPGRTTRKSVKKLLEDIDELAGGLDDDDMELVEAGLDARLERAGLEPVFHQHDDEEEVDAEPIPQITRDKVGRNDPCPCGSGKKYKKCHGAPADA